MKHAITIIFIFFFVISCQTNEKPINATPIVDKEELIKNFKRIIHGSWVQTSYVADISKTKSPLKSYKNLLDSIVEMMIDTSDIRNELLFIGADNLHEACSFFLYFEQGLSATSFPIDSLKGNYSEIAYAITNFDTVLMINAYDKEKKIIHSAEYIKIPQSSVFASEYIVNKMLIAGTYTYINTADQPTTVIFTDDGHVTGFLGSTHYHVRTDFIDDFENNLDKMFISNIIDGDLIHRRREFAYKIEGDTLKLYNSSLGQLVELKYTLVKQ